MLTCEVTTIFKEPQKMKNKYKMQKDNKIRNAYIHSLRERSVGIWHCSYAPRRACSPSSSVQLRLAAEKKKPVSEHRRQLSPFEPEYVKSFGRNCVGAAAAAARGARYATASVRALFFFLLRNRFGGLKAHVAQTTSRKITRFESLVVSEKRALTKLFRVRAFTSLLWYFDPRQ